MIREPKNGELVRIRRDKHPQCFVCGESNPRGLGLEFEFDENSKCAVAEFHLNNSLAGYEGTPHGGIISAIFDGAMGNCLFAHGITPVTAELNIRFKSRLSLHKRTTVRARLKDYSHPFYLLECKVEQEGRIKASATGKFVHEPDFSR